VIDILEYDSKVIK